jgi:predicted secreted protein
MKFGTFKDRRSGKVVFVSNCILNINTKFPGYADAKGSFTEFIIPILEAGIGIFQMPCVEALCWGGVGRTRIEEELQALYRAGVPLEDLDEEWIVNFPGNAARWASFTADQIEDHLRNNYEVLGIIHVANSPCCGLDYVDNFPKIHYDMWDKGTDLNNLDYDELAEGRKRPTIEQMKAMGKSGVGAFCGPLREELKRRGISLPWVGIIPGYRGIEQTTRVLSTIGLIKEEET